MDNKVISIVIPMFNEEENIEASYQELLPIIKQLKHFTSYEIIAVNDGSCDNTLAVAKKIAKQDPHFKIVSFTRNFGHEQATYAGIHHTTGDAIVLIDADLQDPPELILEFEKEFLNGFDVVYGQRKKRQKETIIKKITSKAFYPIFKFLTNIDLPRNVGDFCLMSKRAVDFFKAMPERTLFIRGLIYWPGLPKKSVQFIRRPRHAGTTKYNYSKLTIFALENIISFSTIPIYAILLLSVFMMITCFAGIVIALCMKIFGFVIMTGWTSLMISLLLLSSIILFALGVIGLYIGKIFQEVKKRPVFLIDEKINFEK